MNKIFSIVNKKPLKIFYNAFVSRNTRKRWHYQYQDKQQQQQVADYWNDIIESYFKDRIEKTVLQPIKQELVGKKIIWQYWGQGLDNLPEMVKLCFASVDKFKGDYQVIRITDDNIDNYIKLPDYISNKRHQGIIKPVFFSDILRVALLSMYGGVWLDASILLTDKLPEKYSEYDFFMYSRDSNSNNKQWGKNDTHFYFNWREEFKVKHLSSVMFSQPNSQLAKILTDLLLHYWRNENDVIHYFFFQIMINELKLKNQTLFDFPVVDDTLPHLLQPCMQQKFDQAYFDSILSVVSIHKLTIHQSFKDKVFGIQTYYGYLKSQFDI